MSTSKEIEERLKRLKEEIENLKRQVEEMARRFVTDVYEYVGHINTIFRWVLDVEGELYNLKKTLGVDPPVEKLHKINEEIRKVEEKVSEVRKWIEFKWELYKMFYDLVEKDIITWKTFRELVELIT